MRETFINRQVLKAELTGLSFRCLGNQHGKDQRKYKYAASCGFMQRGNFR